MNYYTHYKKWHDHTNSSYVKWMSYKYKKLLKNHLPADKDSRILEVGCANGISLLALSELGYKNLDAVEISKDMYNIACQFSSKVKNIDIIDYVNTCNVRYNFIYLIDVLEHIDKDKIIFVLQGLCKLLEDKGKLFIITPNATSISGAYFRYIDWTHQLSFTPTSILHLLEESGFTFVDIYEEDIIGDYVEDKELIKENIFFKQFHRWMQFAQFGYDKLSLFVSPNMKVIAYKERNQTFAYKVNVDIDDKIDLASFYYNQSSLYDDNIEIYSLLNIYQKLINKLSIENSKQMYLIDELNSKINENRRKERANNIKYLSEIETTQNAIIDMHKYLYNLKKPNILYKIKTFLFLYKNPKFDSVFYSKKYNINKGHVGSLLHYIIKGDKKLFSPNIYFKYDYYFNRNANYLNGKNILLYEILRNNNE